MSGEEIDTVRALILESLHDAPEQRLLGAVLGNRLRARSGRTIKDCGYKNLSEFVRSHMAAEVVVSPSGPDTMFQLVQGVGVILSSSPVTRPNGTGVSDANLLQLWKSPRSPYKLAVRKSDGATRAISSEAQPGDDEVVLVSPGSHAHQAIATSFIEEHIPEEHREVFRTKLDEPSTLWWREWSTLFSAHLPRLQGQWLRFRESRLLDLLDAALKEAGLGDDARARAHSEVTRSRRAGRALRLKDGATSGQAHEPTLRQAIIASLERLSDEELRRIWLPVGPVYDILRLNR